MNIEVSQHLKTIPEEKYLLYLTFLIINIKAYSNCSNVIIELKANLNNDPLKNIKFFLKKRRKTIICDLFQLITLKVL